MHARAGKFGTSAAVGQVLPPKPQMVAKQDWSYVSGGGRSVYGAHADQSEITNLTFTRDSTTMLSRGADATLKVRAAILQQASFASKLQSICAFTCFVRHRRVLGSSLLGPRFCGLRCFLDPPYSVEQVST